MTCAVRFCRFVPGLMLPLEDRGEGCGTVIRGPLVAWAKGECFRVLSVVLNNLCKYGSRCVASLWLCVRRAPMRA